MLRNRKPQKCSEVPNEQRIIQKSQYFSEEIWSKYALILILIRSLGALLQQTAYVPGIDLNVKHIFYVLEDIFNQFGQTESRVFQ